MKAIYWLVIFVVLLLIEIFTMGLTTVWFAVGALCSFGAALLGFGVPVQVGVFFAVSIILLIVTRPIAIKHFNKVREKTNVESLIGQTAIVLEDIDVEALREDIDSLDPKYKTLVPDLAAIKEDVSLTDEIPEGVKQKVAYKLMKKINPIKEIAQ